MTPTPQYAGRRPWQTWRNQLLDLIYPPQCVACFAPLSDGDSVQICGPCHQTMFVDEIAPCKRCGGRVSANRYTRHCRLCHGERFYFERAVALGNYTGLLRDMIYQFKRRNQEAAALQLGRRLGKYCNELFAKGSDVNCIVPMPSHRMRQWTRGMNPAAIVAEGVAWETNLPVVADLLRSRRLTAKQGTLARSARLENVKGSMRVNPRLSVRGLRVLLVDDVMASGATANEAARTLRAAGIKKISVALIARGMGSS